MSSQVIYGNCKECGGLLTPEKGKMKCILCEKTYEIKEITREL